MNHNTENTEVETNEVATEVVAKQSGAPIGTSSEDISSMLPAERVSRSKALNIVRGQDIKCSQERMTVILEAKYGPLPDKDAAKAEIAAAKEAVKAEAAAERAKLKAEKDEAKAVLKAEKDAVAAETKAARLASKATKVVPEVETEAA